MPGMSDSSKVEKAEQGKPGVIPVDGCERVRGF